MLPSLRGQRSGLILQFSSVGGRIGASPPVLALRLMLAGGELLGGDVAHARVQLDRALPHVPHLPDDCLVDFGQFLTGAVQSAWARNEYDLSQACSHTLAGVAERSGDPYLELLAEGADCVSRLAGRDPSDTAERAEALYERAVDAGNLHLQWTACAARMIVASLTDDPEVGIVWMDRLIPAHASLGSGGGGAFLEQLANFASQLDDHELAVRMHAAGYAESRRLGMAWPVQLNTAELVERTRAAVPPDVYRRLWTEGTKLTYEQVARERGLTPLL